MVVLVAEGDPETAGRPYGIEGRCIGLEVQHDIDGTLISKVDVISFFLREGLDEGL